MSDHCLKRNANNKSATGISVFLMEELGDARLRCSQLKKYIDEAVKLIEKSDQRDHFFEIAAHLMHGIPDTLMRMDKALDAAAMAASKLDYEELADTLQPEKVEELEKALDDVRIRRVKHRSKEKKEAMHTQSRYEEGKPADPTENMSPEDAAEWKKQTEIHKDEFKTAAREEDILYETANLYLFQTRRGLEIRLSGPTHAVVVGKPQDLVSAKRAMDRMELYPDKLRAMYKMSSEASTLADQLVESKFEEGKPADPTENMDADDAKKWKQNTEEYGDKFKSASMSANGDAAKRSRFEEGKPADPTENMDPEDAKEWKQNTEEYGDKFKTAGALNVNKIRSWMRSHYQDHMDPRTGEINATTLAEEAADVFDAYEDRRDYTIPEEVFEISAEVADRYAKFATVADQTHLSRFEEGKPADPTENMDSEDAKEWKRQTEEHKDEFKSASMFGALKTITKKITGLDELPASSVKIERGGKIGRFEDPKRYRVWHAQLVRGKWLLSGNYSPLYGKSEWKRQTEEHKDDFKTAAGDIEYVIWGIPPGEQHENVLHTQSKSMAEAKKIIKILETEHGCTKCRIQVLDLTKAPDFRKLFASRIVPIEEAKKGGDPHSHHIPAQPWKA